MSTLTVRTVTVEHHREPVGIGERTPRLSWITDTDHPGWHQVAYELQIEPEVGPIWASGKVESADSVLVTWSAPPLVSRERRSIRVRVWGDGTSDPSPWSPNIVVEAGLDDPTDWTAQLIHPAATTAQGAALLRREFSIDRPIRTARLYVTAHGVYEAEINGTTVGDHVLAPGWTSYHHRLRYQTHDITQLLTMGGNAIGLHLADGWYRGYLGFAGNRNIYGDRTAAYAQLEIEHTDGSRTVVTTDGTWRSATSPLVRADIYNGETHDTRQDLPGWSTPGFDDTTWADVDTGVLDPAVLVAPTGPPVRRTQIVPAREIITSPSGSTLVDFGQNLVGRIRYRLPDAPAGTQITIRHAEVLENGELGTRPLRAAAQTDEIILDGRGARSWEPRFTFHGFRYAEITGWPTVLDMHDLDAVVIHTDLRPTGTFTCSDPDVNQLHDNVIWGMRGNFIDIPTDCPQRDERLGWTGDLQVFAPTASFLYDTAGMLRSWLVDLATEQADQGGIVPIYVPSPPGVQPPWFPPPQVESGWGDAAVIVPWVLYERHGDQQILADQWTSMTTWINVYEQRAGTNLDFPDGGFMLGDWLDTAAPPDNPAAARTPWHCVATAYLARSARIVAQTATILGHDDTYYLDLAARAAERFRREYVSSTGRVAFSSQTAYALALNFDLLEPAQREHAGKLLAEQVADDGWHIAAGFLGTPYVTDALTDAGQTSTAYELLLQRQHPSWLYPVTMGATTIWERWDSMLPDGSINPGEMTSFNHYAFGAVADWLHRVVAGLTPASPGYQQQRIAPHPGPGITSAAASHETPYGRAAVCWTLTAGTNFTLNVTVPPNTTAEVHLPDRETSRVSSGHHTFTTTITEPQPVVRPRSFQEILGS